MISSFKLSVDAKCNTVPQVGLSLLCQDNFQLNRLAKVKYNIGIIGKVASTTNKICINCKLCTGL